MATREQIETAVQDIMIEYGPDGHIDGSDKLADYAEQLANEARLEGQRSILDRVKQLPSPIESLVDEAAGQIARAHRCSWCGGQWSIERSSELHEPTCLWSLAHTPAPRQAEGQASSEWRKQNEEL